jgi:hypothetical protein
MIKKKINLINEPFGFVNTSIGTLALKRITLGIRGEMYEEFDKKLKDTLPSEYIKILVKYCCVKQKDKESDEILLTKNEISKLTDDDFEKIAKYFIENNDYLNRESKTKNVEEEGEILLTTEYGDISTPKNKDESFQEYLLRLTVKDDLETSESFKKFQGNLASFSKNLQESIKGSLNLGKQLSESVYKIKNLNIPTFEPPIVPKTIKLSPKNLPDFKLSETSSLKTFKEFSSKLEQLIEISASSTEFMVEANKIQTRIADEVKISSDTSTSLSRKNINVSFIVLAVAVLSFFYSIYSINESNKSNAIFVKEIIHELDTINSSIKNNESYLVKEKLTEFKKDLDSIIQLNNQFKKEIIKLKSQRKSKTKTAPNNV